MLEHDLKKWAHDLLEGREIKIQPIESPSTGLGIPDWAYRTFKSDGWIEFKWLDKIGPNIVIPFRPGQYSWLCNYTRLRGNAFLFVGFRDRQNVECLCIFKGNQIRREYEIGQFYRENILCKPLDKITQLVLYYVLQGEHKKCSG